MAPFDNKNFSSKEKLVIYSLLIKVMDADKKREEEEISFLKCMQDALSLTEGDIIEADSLSLDECKEELFSFSDKQRAEVKRSLIEMAYADGVYVDQEKELIKSLKLDCSHHELELIAEWRDEQQKIVGFYTQKEDGHFCFEDIRSLGFSELKYKDDGEIIIEVEKIPELTLNKYYEFFWTTENDYGDRGFHIMPREYKFKEVKAKELVDRLFNNWKNKDYDTIRQMSEVQKMVNTQLTASSDGTFIYELLQNANDYPVVEDKCVQLVDVEFHITDHYLIYRHTGRVFSPRNIAAISKMSDGEKKKEKNAIGYKGIGFKTVFSENQYVYLQSGDYTLRFDESITKKGFGSSKFPWQLMPIWTPQSEVDKEVLDAMKDAYNFRVQMAIRPDDTSKLRDGNKSFEYIFNDIFKDEKDILFIPNIKSVRVFYDGKEKICRTKDPDKWVLTETPLVYTFSPNEVAENNREVMSNKRIPEKYKDFEDTRVSFACQRDGRIIKPVKKARIYCYLPTQVSLGFPFLMNTDMIPTGPRDDFEKKVSLNHKIMKIAGGKFAEWISDLLHSGNYDLCSVFTIMPTFDSVENYEDFIDEFKDGFDSQLDDLEFIPCENGEFSIIYNTIIDETGLLSSGIMSDEEFLELSDWEGSLPAKELRTNRKFKSFVKKYIDPSYVFDLDAIRYMIRRAEFKEWLKVQDNNNEFLKFLLDKDYLEDFMNEDIFLEDEGSLQKAEALYYDVDKYLVDLQAFTNYIYFLSPKTREFFKNNKKWNDTIDGKFAEFNCDDFVNNILLSCANKASTIESLKNKDTSIHFFKFLAEEVEFDDDFTSLPFIADDETIVDNFEDKFLFFTSEKGHRVCESEWLSSISVAFVSNDYTKTTKKYFKDNFGVQIFSDEIIVKDIILSDDYRDEINESQQEDKYTSVAFVKYCFEHESSFGSGALRDYALNSFDCDGDETFVMHEDHIYFPSVYFDEYSQKDWLDYDWMYCLDSDYLKVDHDEEKVKAFLKNAFYIEELDAEKFYKDIVRPNISSIISNTSGSNDGDGTKNIDFIRYLDANYHLVFEKEKDADKFDSFVFIDNGFYDIDSDSAYIYAYDSELKDILDSEWFPADIVNMCTSKYGESKSIVAIKAKKYDFANFFNDVITEELDNINDKINSKEASIAFHSFIIDRLTYLTDKQKEVMKGAKVYLYGNDDDTCDRSDCHHILSKSARELTSMGLVEFSDLDIIDPDYMPEDNLEYWETRLGNTKYTVSHFFAWLKANADTFCDTLQDQELNVKFWRWMKKNSLESHLSEMPTFPVLLKDGSIDNSSDAVYFSDDYMDGAGIEHLVQEYDNQALFISPDYIDEGDNVKEWKNFWTLVGVKFEIVDILVETVIPNLTNIDNEHLPRLLAENRELLEKQYEDTGLVSQLSELRVKGHDGEFYPINETIYIDCEKDEPFPYIKLPNQISFPSAEERRLIKDVINEVDGKCVETLSEWQQHKLNCYLSMQEESENSVRSFHYQFINDLSIIRNDDRDSLKEIEGIEEILLLNKYGEFCDASTLTMGSVYHPFFDFEKCGIESLDYVSDSYDTECSEDVGKLFIALKVHCDFQEDDVSLLEERECSIYFWQIYLTTKDASISRIKDIVNDNLLDDLECIPTKDYMKKPSELYYGSEVSRYVKAIEDWENKIPLSSLPEIKLTDDTTLFSKLPFKESLDFLDALYALISVLGQERRTQLLNWMIDSYNESYNEKIEEYRNDEHALWKNNKNEDVQIKNLYALDYWTKTLDQYFGSNPRIINKAYFPAGDSFKEACDILGIKTITSDDLKMEPINDSIYHDRDDDHKIYALVIAGMTDADNWQELYKGYCQKLEELVLHRCKSIMITYKDDEEINQSLKKFYHKEGDCNFYFVDSLDGKRVFKSFVEEFVIFLGIDTDEIAEDVIEDIMDSRENALEIVKEQNNLMLDEKFKDELSNLIPGIKRELSGNEVDDNEDDEDVTYRPTFTTKDTNRDDDEDTDEGLDSSPQSGSTSEGSGSTARGNTREYSDMSGWEGSRGEYTPKAPKPFPHEDVRNFGSHGVTKTLDVLEPTTSEVEEINRILGEDLSSEQVADQNYLAQLRLYNNLVNREMTPEESKDDFVRNAHLKNEHTLHGGKYIHKCSAAGGIMYLSPSIWNKIADDRCVVCVYLGAKSNEFMYFNSIAEILEWIREDDIIIKLTGEEKANVVEKLYSGVLKGVKGTAYTLIRINSNEKYNSLFAQLPTNNDINETEENEHEY